MILASRLLEAREKCLAVLKSSAKKEPPKNYKDNNIKRSGSSRNLQTSTKPGKNNKVSCTYCRGEHSSADCDIVTEVNSRWSFVKRNNRCFLCLAKGHGLKECTKNACRNCNEKHHVSLCKGNESTELVVNARASTLLQTASVKASSEHKKACNVRVIFDLGSNDSFITSSLKNLFRKIGNSG